MSDDIRRTLFEHEEPPVTASTAPAPPVPIAEPDPVRQVDAEPEPDAIEEPPAGRGRNPWLIVLWVLGFVLLAVGMWGLVQAAERAADPTYVMVEGYGSEQYRAPGVEDFYVVPIILASLAPWLVALGIGSIIAAATVHAVHWSRR